MIRPGCPRPRAAALWLLPLAALSACSPAGDDSPCASSAECFKDQVCVKAACVNEDEARTLLPDACQVPDGTACDAPAAWLTRSLGAWP